MLTAFPSKKFLVRREHLTAVLLWQSGYFALINKVLACACLMCLIYLYSRPMLVFTRYSLVGHRGYSVGGWGDLHKNNLNNRRK